MTLTHKERHQRDREHLDDPKVGDYWHEMFTPVCVVLGRTADEIMLCKKTRASGPDHWTWDLRHVDRMTLEAFREWLCHGGSGPLADRSWASVSPESHEWAREKAMAELLG